MANTQRRLESGIHPLDEVEDLVGLGLERRCVRRKQGLGEGRDHLVVPRTYFLVVVKLGGHLPGEILVLR